VHSEEPVPRCEAVQLKRVLDADEDSDQECA
jgi:hypothetical protein